MSYEPRGKVKDLIDAMRASTQLVWSCDDVAKVMEIPKGNVNAYVNSAVHNGLLHRKVDNGRSHYSLERFDLPGAGPADKPLHIPTLGQPFWQAPHMVAPRGETVVPRAPLPPPLHEVLAPAAEQDPVPAPTPRPKRDLPKVTQPPVEEEPKEEPAVEFNAALWSDGDLFLYGLEEMVDGSVKVPAEHVGALRRLLGGLEP